MPGDETKRGLASLGEWRHEYGSVDSPVVLGAGDANTTVICAALRRVCSEGGDRLFVLGPVGAGKSAFMAAVVAEAQHRNLIVRTLSRTSQPAEVLREVAAGLVDVLVVNRLDELSSSARNGVIQHRNKCRRGLLATAESLSSVTVAALSDDRDVVVNVPPLEERPRDVLALSELFWPEICGAESSLIANCLSEASENLCRGPYPVGASSLRLSLEKLADALISAGILQDGRFGRPVESRDVGDALLAAYRSGYSAVGVGPRPAVIIVEGQTDVVYLRIAAQRAEEEWGWGLLDGCELKASGEERQGGASAVGRRLFELSVQSFECVGVFDNDDVGRRAYKVARGQSRRAELLPAEFDRLRLPEEQRSVEIEDLVCLRVLDRFYETHRGLEPEEVRTRAGGLRRVVPQGSHKNILAEWASREMRAGDCARLIFLLCRLRKGLGLPVPRADADVWLRELLRDDC